MTEKLLVRFGGARAENIEWLCPSKPDSTPVSGTWQELEAAAQDKFLILLVPATAVLLLELELPVKSAAQLQKALPFALEDLLAEDVENYHLVWTRQTDGKIAVAALTHDKLSEYLNLFQNAGLTLGAAYPETLCLPYQAGACTLLVDGDHAVLRSGTWQGAGIETSFVPCLLEKWAAAGMSTEMLSVWSAHAESPLKPGPFTRVQHSSSLPLAVLATGWASAAENLDLLTGTYARQAPDSANWRQWLPALLILAVAFSLQYAVLLNGYWQQQAEFDSLETATQELFKQVFPEVKRIVNVKAQGDQQLAELRKRGGVAASDFMRLLYPAGDVLKTLPDIHLKKLAFVNGALQIQINAPDISRLEQFKQQLQAHLQVKIQSADKDSGANGVEAQLELREK